VQYYCDTTRVGYKNSAAVSATNQQRFNMTLANLKQTIEQLPGYSITQLPNYPSP
jgi:hypothetical protein